MKNEFEYKEHLLHHPLTIKVGKNKSLYDIISDKSIFDYYCDTESTSTAGFVIEITDILSEDVKKILAEHKIKIGDIIYFDFKENTKSRDRANDIKEDARQMAVNILDNKEYYDDLKSTAFTFAKIEPFNDYKIGKLELMSSFGPYDVRDGFFINDSIAEKIVGNVYAVPERALKMIRYVDNGLEMEM